MVDSDRKRLSSAQRRERILNGALQVFAERGYSDASMTAIAAAAGITSAVIYDHFDSKAKLHVTLLDREAGSLLAAVGSAVDAAPEGIGERLRAGVDAFFAFVEEREFAWWMLFRDPPHDPAIARAYARIQEDATQGIAAFLRTEAPPEVLARPDADRDLEMFAQLLRTAQNGLAAWWYEHRQVPREVLVDRVIEFAWVGLERVASGKGPAGAAPS